MFWSKNKENRYTPAYPSFTIYKWGIRGYAFHEQVFLMLPQMGREINNDWVIGRLSLNYSPVKQE